jgi:16S rRNA pseudouridine516 synthase
MDARRLDKLVADFARLSRKDAKLLIRRGLVTVNGEIAANPDAKVEVSDTVIANGKILPPLGHSYIMLNKPAGVLTATRDARQKTVLDLLPEHLARKGLFPAGRLDKDTEGFVLITDDGDFAHRILAPKNKVPKTYCARLSGPVDQSALIPAFAEGLKLGEKEITSPAVLTVLESAGQAQVRLVIYEGMYHQIKRMFALFGLEVLYLRREAIGGLVLDAALGPGEARRITPDELEALL